MINKKWRGGTKRNQATLKKGLYELLVTRASELQQASKSNFSFLKQFKVTVPTSYNHKDQSRLFFRRHSSGYWFNRKFNYRADVHPGAIEGFCDYVSPVTSELIPGKVYTVKVFKSDKENTLVDYLDHCKSIGAYLVGTRGLTLAWEQQKEEFPRGMVTFCLDKLENCYNYSRYSKDYRAPFVSRLDEDGEFSFSSHNVGLSCSSFGVLSCILCYCEE